MRIIDADSLMDRITELPDDVDMLTIGRVIELIDTQPTVSITIQTSDIAQKFAESLRR